MIDPALKRRLARAFDVFLIVAGPIVAHLATDPEAGKVLAPLGGWVTSAIGVLNILLNRVPAALRAMPDETDEAGA